ncbi:MAG TPA: DUF1566 domain-containing protein [Arcobacter sp.]|nr:DUF1566 domain-containing protein [Arcobacter sp.]
MINLQRVLQSLCDLFTDVYIANISKDINNFLVSFLYLINKRFNSSNYWSATTNASDTSNAWNVNFNNGNDNWNDKTNTYFVRCVRLADNDKKFYYV